MLYGYIRVSSQEQKKGTSPDDQRERIKKYAKSLGHPIQIFEDVESAGHEKIEKRVNVHALLKKAKNGDTIICAKVDRWARDTLFAIQSIREHLARGIKFYFIAESLDPSTSQGEFVFTIMAAVAQQERDRIKERTNDGRAFRTAQGNYMSGSIPLGYKRADRGKDNKYLDLKLHIAEDTSPIIVDIFTRCIRGDGLRIITQHLEKTQPWRSWDVAYLRRILNNRYYLGWVRNGEAWIKDAHEPIITEATFSRAQAALQERRVGSKGRAPSGQSHTSLFLLRGELAKCQDCGTAIGTAYALTRPGSNYQSYLNRPRPDGRFYRYYYRCGRALQKFRTSKTGSCSAANMQVEMVDAAVSDLTLKRLQELSAELSKQTPTKKADTIDYQPQILKLEQKRSRTIDLHVDGTLTKKELDKRLQEIDQNLHQLKAHEAEQVEAIKHEAPKYRATVLADIKNIQRAWLNLSWPEKREIVKRLSNQVTLHPEKGINIVWLPISRLL